MVQQSPAQGGHGHRQHRRRLPQWPQADAPAGGDIWRDAAQARPRQDALPQNRQRQQGPRLHRQQGGQTSIYRRRR